MLLLHLLLRLLCLLGGATCCACCACLVPGWLLLAPALQGRLLGSICRIIRGAAAAVRGRWKGKQAEGGLGAEPADHKVSAQVLSSPHPRANPARYSTRSSCAPALALLMLGGSSCLCWLQPRLNERSMRGGKRFRLCRLCRLCLPPLLLPLLRFSGHAIGLAPTDPRNDAASLLLLLALFVQAALPAATLAAAVIVRKVGLGWPEAVRGDAVWAAVPAGACRWQSVMGGGAKQWGASGLGWPCEA